MFTSVDKCKGQVMLAAGFWKFQIYILNVQIGITIWIKAHIINLIIKALHLVTSMSVSNERVRLLMKWTE